MSAPAARPSAPALSPLSATWLVAERELVAKVRSKSFLVSTAILVVLALAGVLWAGFSAANAEDETIPVAATAELAGPLADVPGVEVTEIGGRADAEELVRDGDVDAAVLPDPSAPAGVLLLGDEEVPDALVSALSVTPAVELLQDDAEEGPLRYLLGIGFGLVFMMSAITFGSPITMSVIEEKQTRVVEILLSAIPARVLLAGKVVGNTILAIGQILLLAAVGVIGLVVTGQTTLLGSIGGPVVWFAVFFLFGFVLLAGMFAAAGSLVSRQEDSGPTLTPVMYLTMIPYLLVVFFGDNPVVMTVLSYVPFSAPVAMPVRLFFGEAQWWEPLAALGILLVSCAAVIALGARIYENSLLRMGGRVKLADALKG